ncbi:MAG: hypothetical protein ACOH1Y_18360 [Propionicimonas sp.]
MTSPTPPALTAGGKFPAFRIPDANWHPDWEDVVNPATWEGVTVPGFRSPRTVIVDIQRWLRFTDPLPTIWITVVRATYRTYGTRARLVLDAYTSGATARFVTAYLSRREGAVDVREAWHQTLARTGITEPQAVGWAYTDLYRRDTPDPSITAWSTRFGPAAYLWVLAGYDLAEAWAIQASGTIPTDEQLRVMVALAGYTLPAGI